MAELSDGRLHAVLPARGGDDVPERTLESATGSSSGCAATGSPPSRLSIPIPASCIARREAELVLDVDAREPPHRRGPRGGIAASGVYRLSSGPHSDPEEVRSFYDDTVEPIVRYDTQYRSDLLGTLEEYLASDAT